MRIALRDAENEVDRVGALLTAAETVGDRVDTASRIVSKTVTNPVVKVLALGTGTKRAVRRMRAGDEPTAEERSVIPKRVFWLAVGLRRRDRHVVVRGAQGEGGGPAVHARGPERTGSRTPSPASPGT